MQLSNKLKHLIKYTKKPSIFNHSLQLTSLAYFCNDKQPTNNKSSIIIRDSLTNKPITADDMKQITNINKNKKQSQWIYSTKHEEMVTGKQGNIIVYPHLPSDTHNVSLRFISALKSTKFVITSKPQLCHGLFRALRDQYRYTQDCLQKQQIQQATVPIVTNQNNKTMILSDLNPHHSQISDVQYNAQIQVSKYIELQKQGKLDADTYRRRMAHTQISKLKDYMQFKAIDEQITNIANEQSYPTIFALQTDKMGQYLELQTKGMNIMFVFPEQDIEQCGKSIKILEEKQKAYEIFPSSDELIEAIVTSGLPADRFSLDYYPTQINLLLSRRKPMKMTLAIKLPFSRLKYLLDQIQQVFTDRHIVYVKIPKKQTRQYHQFRGQVSQVKNQLNENYEQIHDKNNINANIIVAPYIVDFNQSLKQQLDVKSHLLGQLQSNKINLVQMQILSKKLDQYKNKQMVHNLNLYLLTAQLISRLQNRDQIKSILRDLVPKNITNQLLEQLISTAQKQIVPDYLELNKI